MNGPCSLRSAVAVAILLSGIIGNARGQDEKPAPPAAAPSAKEMEEADREFQRLQSARSAPATSVPKADDANPSAQRQAAAVELTPKEIYAQSSPAVVTITTKDDLGHDNGLGSGFFMSLSVVGTRHPLYRLVEERSAERAIEKRPFTTMYLLTNYHVIESAADAEVQLKDGRKCAVVDILMEDERRDLAALAVLVPSDQTRQRLAIAVGNDLEIGEQVYTIGSPKGLEGTLSRGLVTGKRVIEGDVPWLQTDAAISPGSSGGPMLDSKGRVAGVIVASHKKGQNLNFAIPASEVNAFLSGPVKTRKVWRGTGTAAESADAYFSALAASATTSKADCELLRTLSQAGYKVGDETYWPKLSRLSQAGPGEMDKWQYLIEYTIGRFADSAGYKAVSNAGTTTIDERRRAYRNNEDVGFADESFRKAIRLKRDFSPAYLHLAWSLQKQGRFEEGLAVADKLVKVVPRCTSAYKLRGEFYVDFRRDKEGLADFKKAVELGPTDPETYCDLGKLYLFAESKEYALAAAAYEKAIALYEEESPVDKDALGLCYSPAGHAYMRMGKYRRALDCFERAKELGLSFPSMEEDISECRERLGQ